MWARPGPGAPCLKGSLQYLEVFLERNLQRTAKALLCSTGIGLTANIPVSEAMARRNQSKAAVGRCKSKADRSSYFARREAAKVLRIVLQGDAARNAKASIKSLVYSPSVRNKKATFALLCQTLKCMHQSILISSNTSHAFRFF